MLNIREGRLIKSRFKIDLECNKNNNLRVTNHYFNGQNRHFWAKNGEIASFPLDTKSQHFKVDIK